jgi:hypothetical protein
VSYFEKEKEGGGRPSVNITITGIGGDTQVVGEDELNDIIDAEVVDVDNER